MPKRAMLLGRTSYDDRDTDGRNLQGQLDMCREYALKKGYVIVAELAEDVRGVSGAILYTPELARALEMARAGRADVLVLRELDRLGRSLAKQLIVEQDFDKAGCEIEYVLGSYPDTPEGGLMKHVGASVAEYERLKIAERTTRARRAVAKAGGVLGHGKAPFGYQVVQGKHEFAVNEDEAQVVRQVFRWFVSERLTIDGIVRKLNEMGVPARGGGRWNRSVVHKMLKREAYAGTWYYGKYRWETEDGRKRMVRNSTDYWIPVQVPAVIEREVWLVAQRSLRENRENASRRKKYDYLLTGRIFCACGSRAYGKSKRQRRGKVLLYYRCPKCDLPFFRADQVDNAAWEWTRGLLLNPAELVRGLEARRSAQGAEAGALRGRLAELDDLLAQNKAKQEKLLDLFLNSEFPRETLMKRNEDLEASIVALERERAAVASELEVQALTDQQTESLQEFAAQVAGKLAAGCDFKTRKEIVEALGVRAILSLEDGRRVARIIVDTIPAISTNSGCSDYFILTAALPIEVAA